LSLTAPMPAAYDLWGMRHLASIRRRDGHTIDGTPGDCWRCCVAYLMAAPAGFVPHFGLYGSWWWETRRWMRAVTRDRFDLYYRDLEDPDGYRMPDMPPGKDDFDPDLVILGGPSPRGPWRHVIVGRMEAGTPTPLFDPHPSGAGLAAIDELFLIRPSLPWPLHGIPLRTALERAA
jgi:hypothetical protein